MVDEWFLLRFAIPGRIAGIKSARDKKAESNNDCDLDA